jgi:hypothetical protein
MCWTLAQGSRLGYADGGHGNRATGDLDNGQHQQREDKAEHEKSKKLTSTCLQNRNSTNSIDHSARVTGPQVELSNSDVLRTFHGGVGRHDGIWRISR